MSKSDVYIRASGRVRRSRYVGYGAHGTGVGYDSPRTATRKVRRIGFGLLENWGEANWTAKDLR